MAVADVPEEPLHLVDRTGDPVGDDDPGDADADDEQREQGNQHGEHLALLTAEIVRALAQREGVALELLLLGFEPLVLLARALVEDRGELGIRPVDGILHDVHVDDGRHLLALANDFLSALDRLLPLLHRLLTLRDHFAARRPQGHPEADREQDRGGHQVARVFQLEVRIEQDSCGACAGGAGLRV